jgi:hypothetical protein
VDERLLLLELAWEVP